MSLIGLRFKLKLRGHARDYWAPAHLCLYAGYHSRPLNYRAKFTEKVSATEFAFKKMEFKWKLLTPWANEWYQFRINLIQIKACRTNSKAHTIDVNTLCERYIYFLHTADTVGITWKRDLVHWQISTIEFFPTFVVNFWHSWLNPHLILLH